jgi:hypothetical protein
MSDDYELTDEDAALFKEITDMAMSDTAHRLLDTQLGRLKEWKRRREAAGLPCTLHDLIKQVMHEPNKRRHVLVAYSAALWRLMEESDGC